jgi:DNA-binding LytR/AlgR family response regulator
MSSKLPVKSKQFFFIREGNRHHRIDFARIRYLEARKSYCRINTLDKVWMVAVGISQLEEVLPPDDFCRIHRSYIVGLAHMDWFENNLLRVADQDLPIGDSYRAQLRQKVMLVPGETPRTRVIGPVVSSRKAMILA